MKKKKFMAIRNRLVAMVSCLALTAGLLTTPVTVFAKEAEVSSQTATLANPLVDYGVNLALGLIKDAGASLASEGMGWVKGKLMSEVFGIESDQAQLQYQLSQILNEIKSLQSDLKNLQDSVDGWGLNDILNNNMQLLENSTTKNVFDALVYYNGQYDGGKEYDDTTKKLIISELIDSLGNGTTDNPHTMESQDNKFDTFTKDLWKAMTMPYYVKINGNEMNLNMLQVHYEHLRYKYFWEHQAYREWANFQNKTVSLLATALFLERASLMARIELIDDYTGKHPEDPVSSVSLKNFLYEIQDHIFELAGYKGTDSRGKEINYKGLFSEAGWADTYWLYKDRSEKYRYYWVHGHEALFLAHVGSQDIPKEPEGAYFDEKKCTYKGIYVQMKYVPGSGYQYQSWIQDPGLYYDFFKDKESQTVSDQQLQWMHDDYESYLKRNNVKNYDDESHLYNIFIDLDKGFFKGLEEGDIRKWYLPVYPEGDHDLYIDSPNASKPEARFYTKRSGSDQHLETNLLARYDGSSVSRNKKRHFLHIRVVRYGPETESYSFNSVLPPKTTSRNTRTVNNNTLWSPGMGDFSLAYNSASHGNVQKLTMDGAEIPASSYAVNGDEIVLNKAYMDTLPLGTHTLIIVGEKSNHTLEFKTGTAKKKQKISGVSSKISRTYSAKTFNLKAKATGKGALTFFSEEPDVADIDESGMVTMLSSGTAKIVITAPETDKYASAEKTVTVTVKKASNPLKLSAKKVNVDKALLAEADQTLDVNNVISFKKKADDNKTYTLVSVKKKSKSYNGYVGIDTETGNVTLKKGMEPGTYKIKVKVKAQGDDGYKASSNKMVTFTVNVV